MREGGSSWKVLHTCPVMSAIVLGRKKSSVVLEAGWEGGREGGREGG